MSGLKPGNGEEELGMPVNLGEKMGLEKGRIDVLNVCVSLFPSTRTSNEIFMLINHELSQIPHVESLLSVTETGK